MFKVSYFCSFLLVIMIMTQGFILSQPYEITASDFEFNLGSTSIHKIIGHDKDNYFVLKHFGNQYHLEKLDRNLNFLLEEPVKLYEKLKTYDLESVVHFHGELYIFVSRRKFSETVLYYQKIDKESLRPLTGFIELTTINFIRGNWPDFHFVLSRRETKLLIACRIKLNWEKVQHNELFVYDKGMELVWERKDYFEFSGQGPRENEYLVDEQGNISILSLIKRESILSLFQDIKNSYIIYRYTNAGKTFREYPIALENRYIRGVKILGGENGELICSGLYSELFRTGVGGTFFFMIDPENGTIYYNQLHPFSKEFLARLMDVEEPIMADEEVLRYTLTDLILRKNGNVILIAEQLFEQSYNTYNNLIISCFDTTGRVNWSQVVQKRQDYDIRYLMQYNVDITDYRSLVRDTGSLNQFFENYCSYALIAPLERNDITIIYNDHFRNLEQGGKQKNFNNPRKSYLAAAHIDEFGNLTEYNLLRWKRKSLYPEPLRYYDTLGETVIIPAFRGRKFNYYKITTEY